MMHFFKSYTMIALLTLLFAPLAWSQEVIPNEYLDLSTGNLVRVLRKDNRADGRWSAFNLRTDADITVDPRDLDPLVTENNGYKKDMRVTFPSEKAGVDGFGRVRAVSRDGHLAILTQSIGATNRMSLAIRHFSQVHKELPEGKDGVKKGSVLCAREDIGNNIAKGDDVEVRTVFANDKAEVAVGEFFGLRFAIFESPAIVPLAKLGACGKDSANDPTINTSQSAKVPDTNRGDSSDENHSHAKPSI